VTSCAVIGCRVLVFVVKIGARRPTTSITTVR